MASRPPSPRYGWNPNAARYVDLNTGRFMSRQAIQDIVEGRIEASIERMNDLLYAALEGTGNIEDWHTAMEQELKDTHLQIAALGKGGWNQMTPADYGRVGRRLRDEYAFLNDFADDINQGRLSLAEIENRMQMYASAVWSQYWESQNIAKARVGATHMKRNLDPSAKHCNDCRRYAAQGVVEIGAVPVPGRDSECGPRCRCDVEYYKSVRGRWVRVV